MTKTLWRAAPAKDPFFGFGSYWSPTAQFANRFRLWLDEHFGPGHVVYTANIEIDETHTLDMPFSVSVSSTAWTNDRLITIAGGFRWISFYEGAFEGTVVRQYIYLGADPIVAVPA